MKETARGIPARIGIAALNLLAPGLGLLRVQKLKAAFAFLFAPHVLLAMLVLGFATAPTLSFSAWAALMAVLLIGIVLIYLGSIIWSWRASRATQPTAPWWSRWYGLLGVVLLIVGIGNLLSDAARSYYRVFYLPSDAMMPTLNVNDRLLASMHGAGDLRRGDIVLLEVSGGPTYIKRVAALPGDRIEIANGIVILNSRPVTQRFLRAEAVEPGIYGTKVRRLAEQFPGEASPHEIYDLGNSSGDDMAEQRVLPGRVFVLGDNRDQSADSRHLREEMGLEQVPIADIGGHALFYLWGPSGRMGGSLNR